MVKVASNIKQGESNILSQQDWDLFNQNIRVRGIANCHLSLGGLPPNIRGIAT